MGSLQVAPITYPWKYYYQMLSTGSGDSIDFPLDMASYNVVKIKCIDKIYKSHAIISIVSCYRSDDVTRRG